MPTRIAYQRELCRRLYEGDLPQIAGANTSSSGTTITDTTAQLNYASGDTSFYDGVYIYVVTSAEAARGQGRVTRGGWTVTGSLTTKSIASLASGDLYVLSKHPPLLLQNAINRILRNTYQPAFFPLSVEIVGGDANDMEASDLDASGVYSKTNDATVAEETTIVYNGAQSMKVTAGAADVAALSGLIKVNEGQAFYAGVFCSVALFDEAEFKFADGESLVDIENANATSDEVAWMSLVFPFTIPSGVEQIRAYFVSVNNGDITYWDDFQLWRQGPGVYPVPSWIEWPEQIIDVRGFPQGAGGPASDNDYRINERASVPLNWHIEREDQRGTTPLHIWVEGTGGRRPYIYAHRPFAELTADDGTSTADLDGVVEDALLIVQHPDRAAQYLATLRQNRLGGSRVIAPTRVGVR